MHRFASRFSSRAFSTTRVAAQPTRWGLFGLGALGVAAGAYVASNNKADASTSGKKYHGVVIFGAPASGKGTQSEFMVRDFGYVHLSSGDILRSEVARGTPLGQEAKGCMDAGKLVPDHLVIGMIKNKLLTDEVTKNGWLLDGMPRTAVQAKALDEMGCHPDLIISLEVPDDVLVERVSGRREDPVTKKIYHMKFNPPPADVLARCTQRSDDTEEKLRVRLAGFHAHSKPIIKYYSGNGDPVIILDGCRAKEVVYGEIKKKLSEK